MVGFKKIVLTISNHPPSWAQSATLGRHRLLKVSEWYYIMEKLQKWISLNFIITSFLFFLVLKSSNFINFLFKA